MTSTKHALMNTMLPTVTALHETNYDLQCEDMDQATIVTIDLDNIINSDALTNDKKQEFPIIDFDVMAADLLMDSLSEETPDQPPMELLSESLTDFSDSMSVCSDITRDPDDDFEVTRPNSPAGIVSVDESVEMDRIGTETAEEENYDNCDRFVTQSIIPHDGDIIIFEDRQFFFLENEDGDDEDDLSHSLHHPEQTQRAEIPVPVSPDTTESRCGNRSPFVWPSNQSNFTTTLIQDDNEYFGVTDLLI